MYRIDYEAEYDNRARVPEHPQIIERWKRDAAAFRAAMGPRACLDIQYGTTRRMQYDLFLPPQGAGPLALFVHGGYWRSFDGKLFSHLARGLVENGITVAVASYDLCPTVPVAVILDELRQCCACLWNSLRRPITVYGHSAGGHLAAALLATEWPRHGLPTRLVPAACSVSGLFDLLPLTATSINADLRLSEREAIRLSPTAMPPPAGTRLIAVVGSEESAEYHRQSRVIVDIWARAMVETRLVMAEGMNHFTVVAPLADPASGMVADIAALARMNG